MNSTEQIQLSGKIFHLPSDPEELKDSIKLVELKDQSVRMTRVAFFWGVIYLLSQLLFIDLILLILGLYFIFFAFITRGKYSPKYFLSHSVIVLIIASLNLIYIFSTHTPIQFQATWIIISIYQFGYAIKMLVFYHGISRDSSGKIKGDNYSVIKQFFKTLVRSKAKQANNVVELRHGTFGFKITRFFLAPNYILGADMVRRKLIFYDKENFMCTKIKKIFLEKKYKVALELSGQKMVGTMLVKDYEKIII